eukprot:TRINITY_DN917_c0_g1_i1.p1 TRINITY_DN917_c0_g1~~TRINITY_DN917_c0_g1_i1.p1  ORF type:complete len:140 (-),score=19.56 TRINITY_DN917_c0_g1_i1:471-890(-)
MLASAAACRRTRPLPMSPSLTRSCVGHLPTRPEPGAQVCIQNSGGMRASIDEDDITIEEILSVLPFGNVYAVLTVPGSAIVGALEYGFDAVVSGEIAGRFPQVGGMRVVVDYSKARSANELSRFTLVSSQSIWACSTCW